MKNSALLPIFLIIFVDILGVTIILPLLPFYAESLGASPFVIGLLVSVYAFCQLIGGPILGQISDKVGRKPVLLFSQIGSFIGFVILALSNTLWVVFLARVIDGLTAGNVTVAQAYISDHTDKSNRAKAFGIIGAAFSFGLMSGPAISGVLSKYGNHTPIWAAACLSLVSICATSILLKGGRPQPPADSEAQTEKRKSVFQTFRAIQTPRLSALLLQFTAYVFAFTTFISGLALFSSYRFQIDGQRLGPQEVGYVFAYLGCLGLIIQGALIGPLTRRFGEKKIITYGFLLMTCGYGLLSIVHSIPVLLCFLTLNTLGSSVLRPTVTSLITQAVAPHQQGVVLGSMQSIQSIAQIIAPLLSGFLIEHMLLGSWALTSAAIASTGFIGIAIHVYSRKKQKAKNEE